MKMKVKFQMRVFTSTADEAGEVERLNAEIDALGLGRGARRAVNFDDSLSKDFNQVIRDLGQLMNRADARRKKRR
jgi:hypothetical protein